MSKWGRCLTIGFLVFAGASASVSAETIKIAWIDPLSGAFANVGESTLRHTQFAADVVNSHGGVLGGKTFEIVPFDGKASAQDSVLALQKAIDQGIRYVIQGAGSNVTHALRDAIEKHNLRNPERSVLQLNIAGNDSTLVNERCSFWHFRFDAGTDMKMQALGAYVAAQSGIKKVYLINQDYAFGQAVARAAREMLPARRPDLQIVGDDLHPFGKVKDFSPYVSKITAAGADTVVTGNWGSDMSLLVKASNDAGARVNFLTYWGNIPGSPKAFGTAGVGHVKVVSQWFANTGGARTLALAEEYRRRYEAIKDDYFISTALTAIEMVAKAMTQAGSADPLAVAKALENMKWQSDTGEVEMRADNHQLLQPLFIASFVNAEKSGLKFDAEGTGNGFRIDYRIEGKDTALPTTCKMVRPE
jgi:branched-chain amino acid transport system substrate-binding protein